MIDSKTFRQALGRYPTGVCVVTAIDDDNEPVGMTVGTFTSVSLTPSLVGFLPDKNSTTWQTIRSAGKFCINILSESQAHLSNQFANPKSDKFAGVSYKHSPLGSPVLSGVTMWIDCKLYGVHEAGDHVFVLGEVTSVDFEGDDGPLVYHGGQYCMVASPVFN